MPTLTNTMGLDFAFRADTVVAVCDRDPESAAQMTCVYGLGTTFQKINETVDGFLSRIGMLDKFAKFTRPNGTSVWINAPAVTVVTMAQEGLFGQDVKAIVVAGGFTQAVKETLQSARQQIADCGGAL